MDNRTTILILSAVLIAAASSGCVQETLEIEAPQSNVTPLAATSDAAQPAPAAEVTSLSASAGPEIRNWKYVSYRNLSISNAPALNQTARITFSIIPDKDIEILLIHVSFLGPVSIWGTGDLTEKSSNTDRDPGCPIAYVPNRHI